ncbi:trypco2 family protein [Flavobacterium psychrotrophum]|uniref:trypco2 family protein n=1 Tax=Flavobacterium psychrotrophum TaxID=2294119 RepID=UPI000E3194AF|nr:trypco2 family protein [Flavobacterium psychrotrophum]
MKKFILIFILIANHGLAQTSTETLPLDQVITIINNSLDSASNQLKDVKLNITEAEVSLSTIYDKSGGGGFKIFVKAEKKWELEKTSTMTYSYKKVEQIEKINKSLESLDNSFKNSLTKAIVQAAKQWKDSSNTVKGLNKDSFSVEISFAFTSSGGAGFEVEVWGIGLDASVNLENTAVHTISLTFK